MCSVLEPSVEPLTPTPDLETISMNGTRESVMGANSTFTVKVLKLVEGYVEVSALHQAEAMEEAEKLPGVAKALKVMSPEFYSGDPHGLARYNPDDNTRRNL